jgi:hypothetical protein
MQRRARGGHCLFAPVTLSRHVVPADQLSVGSPKLQERDHGLMPKRNGKKTKGAARRYRDSLTGRFVTRTYAKKHKKTTVKERRIEA